MRHHANLDMLRAGAVCCVLLDHLALTLHFHTGLLSEAQLPVLKALGHAGVLLFFVHTSLVLMYSLERLHAAGGAVARVFYVRRAFRIYPLAMVAIGAALLMGVPSDTWGSAVAVTRVTVVSNLLLVQNLWGKKQVLSPLWSLPYEVQMYVVLPVLYLLARRRRGGLLIAGLLVVFSGLGALLAVKTGHLNMAAYVPCFLSGVLCYALRDRVRARLPAVLWVPFLVGLVGAYVSYLPIEEEPPFWSGWLLCLVLAFGIHAFRDSDARWLNRGAEKVAVYSYGVYLLHPVALWAVFEVLAVRSPVAGAAAVVVLTAVAAVAGFHLVEAPCMEWGKRLSGSLLRRRVAEPAEMAPAP